MVDVRPCSDPKCRLPTPDFSDALAIKLLRQLPDMDQPPATHLQTGEFPCPAHSNHSLGGESEERCNLFRGGELWNRRRKMRVGAHSVPSPAIDC